MNLIFVLILPRPAKKFKLDFVATILDNVATNEFFVFRGMTSREKLLKKFLRNPTSLRYPEIEKILLSFGFFKRPGKGSHVTFIYPKPYIIQVVPVHQNDCLPVYKKIIAKIIIKIFL